MIMMHQKSKKQIEKESIESISAELLLIAKKAGYADRQGISPELH